MQRPSLLSPDTVVSNALEAWAAGNLDESAKFIHPNCIHIVNMPDGSLPTAGRAEGREVIRERLAKMLECFEYLVFRPFEIVDVGENVRSRVEIVVRHRASRETYFGKLRLVITVENGLMTRIEEFHDAALLEAFMRFAESLE